jgi:EF hand/EF-hand domain pair
VSYSQDVRLDQLEVAIRKRLDTLTGFADAQGQLRELEKIFNHFDDNNSGLIEFNEFFAAMTRLNFIGVQVRIHVGYIVRGFALLPVPTQCGLRFKCSTNSNQLPLLMGLAHAYMIAAIQRELEALFDRYDEDCSGSLDYNEFGQHLLGLKAPPCSDASKSAIERVSLVFKCATYLTYSALYNCRLHTAPVLV